MKFIKAIITTISLFIGSTAIASTCTDYIGGMASLDGYEKKVVTICTDKSDSITVNGTKLTKVNDHLYTATFSSDAGEYFSAFHYLVQKGYWVFMGAANAATISVAHTTFVSAPKELHRK